MLEKIPGGTFCPVRPSTPCMSAFGTASHLCGYYHVDTTSPESGGWRTGWGGGSGGWWARLYSELGC